MTTRRGKKTTLLIAAVASVLVGLGLWLRWPHITFLLLFQRLGPNAQGNVEYRHRCTGMVFVRISGGSFLMGAQDADPNAPNYDPMAQYYESPVHEVDLAPFLIAKYEATQAQWRAVLGTAPSYLPGEELPVETVCWYDCLEFCARTGLRLPTEAQWEYACRAGSTGPFSGTGRLDDMGWYKLNSGRTTHPVGEKLPNAFGLHDMHGNVSEWCADEWELRFYSSPEAGGQDPCAGLRDLWKDLRERLRNKEPGGRVQRGGHYGTGAAQCRSATREATSALYRGAAVGFRPAYYPLP